MAKGKLYAVCFIIGLVVFLLTLGPVREGFGQGVREHPKCIENPDNWWCSMFGAGD